MPLVKQGDKLVCFKHGEVERPAWLPCWNGCDEGYFDGDEGDVYPCYVCAGRGGWKVCPECNLDNPDVEF